jgi:hypothetical protein
LPFTLFDLCEAEIGQQDVAVVVQQNVLWLQVAVDYPRLVQVPESKSDLGDIEFGAGLREPTLLGQVLEQLTTPMSC